MATYFDWLFFGAAVVALLGIDFITFQRQKSAFTLRQAAIRSVFWISMAVLFGLFVFLRMGAGAALDFATAYIIEKSLSIDNLFVFAVIFAYFGVKLKNQRKALFWGIVGAVAMRGIFIFAGVQVIEAFHPSIYIFGAFLLYSGYGLYKSGLEEADPESNVAVRWVGKLLPVSKSSNPKKFFEKSKGRTMATTLFVALLVIEISDIMFAQDSVPSVLTITTNFYVAYTSNIFAILGLRALYFLVVGLLKKIRYLHFGLAALMGYLGAKFLMSDIISIPTVYSLLVISVILGVTIIASWKKDGAVHKKKNKRF